MKIKFAVLIFVLALTSSLSAQKWPTGKLTVDYAGCYSIAEQMDICDARARSSDGRHWKLWCDPHSADCVGLTPRETYEFKTMKCQILWGYKICGVEILSRPYHVIYLMTKDDEEGYRD